MKTGKDVVKKDWKLYKLNASLSDGDRLFAIEGCVDSKTGDMRFYKVDGDDDLRTDFKTLISLRDFLIDLNLDKITNPKDCDTLCDIDDRYVTKEEFESFKGSTGYSIGKITSILAKLAIRTL